MKESQIQSEILLALSESACVVWRVGTSRAWVGKIIHKHQNVVTLDNATMILTGLAVGGSDIIGIHRPTGRFIAIEVKSKNGRPTKEQLNFIRIVKEAGGIAGIARSVEDALALLP